MAHTAEISQANPTCVLFLIDQSGAMAEPLDPSNIQPLDQPVVLEGVTYTHGAQGRTKAMGAADAINRLLYDLSLQSARVGGIRDYYYIGVIGYGETVGPAFTGPLAGKELVPISEVAHHPARIDPRTRKVADGTGGLVDETVQMPIWFDPVAKDGTPMNDALRQAKALLTGWLAAHPSCFPPIVINITGGESTDGDPSDAAHELVGLASDDGNVLLFNAHISAADTRSIEFPDSEGELPDELARLLFRMSSLLPASMRTYARELGYRVSDNTRGFAFNGDMVAVTKYLGMMVDPTPDLLETQERPITLPSHSVHSSMPEPYTGEISQANPTCVLFLIDQSGAMAEARPMNATAQHFTKAEWIADAINRLLTDLVIQCVRDEGIRDCYYVGVIGYGSYVGPALGGPLAGKELVLISEIADNPARVEQRSEKFEDGAGGVIDRTMKFPVWFDATAHGGAPMCEALGRARSIVAGWVADYPSCFPPIVINITGGESTDGDPSDAARELVGLASDNGNVLLFNAQISSAGTRSVEFPDSEGELPDELARLLFRMSSVLPAPMRAAAQDAGYRVSDNSRGFIHNADTVALIHLLRGDVSPALLPMMRLSLVRDGDDHVTEWPSSHWPTPQDYDEAIQNPALCFRDQDLREAHPDTWGGGGPMRNLPLVIAGPFGVVFHLEHGARTWAVKCFTSGNPEVQQRYEAISQRLSHARLPYTVGFELLSPGIKVRGQWYPVLKMEWVEGDLLIEYINKHIDDPAAIRALARRWKKLTAALAQSSIAHGDLEHASVFIAQEDYKLVDYDGMFVPALAGRTSQELGHPNYQSPRRTAKDFGPYLDHFSEWVIYLSLVALSVEPVLWSRPGAGDECLLLRKGDYEQPERSELLQYLLEHPEPHLRSLAARFVDIIPLPVPDIPALSDDVSLFSTALGWVRRHSRVQGAGRAT